MCSFDLCRLKKRGKMKQDEIEYHRHDFAPLFPIGKSSRLRSMLSLSRSFRKRRQPIEAWKRAPASCCRWNELCELQSITCKLTIYSPNSICFCGQENPFTHTIMRQCKDRSGPPPRTAAFVRTRFFRKTWERGGKDTKPLREIAFELLPGSKK